MLLTDRQKTVLQYVRDYSDVRGKPPTVREIASHIGRAVSTTAERIDALERKGAIRRAPGEHRNIEIPE